MDRQRRPLLSGLDTVKLIVFLAAFHPNCTRCCPEGFGGCECEYAWQDCPQNSGCNSCGSNNGCSTTNAQPSPLGAPFAEAGARGETVTPQPQSASTNTADAVGGTIAFVTVDAGTFAVVAVGADDKVRVVRVDPTHWDEDPLTVRSVGDVALQSGDDPGRVVADGHGHALVALRHGGAIATIDPLTVSLVSRRRVCDAPHGLAFDAAHDAVHVACSSGEVLTIRSSDDQETRRVSLGANLQDVGVFGDSVVATSGSRVFVVDASGAFTSRDAHDAIGALRSANGNVVVGIGRDLGAITVDGFGPASPAPAAITDLGVLDDATAIVADDEALLRTSATTDFARIGAPGLTRAVAITDVTGWNVTRRVLALQTESPRMLVLFTLGETPTVAALEPLE